MSSDWMISAFLYKVHKSTGAALIIRKLQFYERYDSLKIIVYEEILLSLVSFWFTLTLQKEILYP